VKSVSDPIESFRPEIRRAKFRRIAAKSGSVIPPIWIGFQVLLCQFVRVVAGRLSGPVSSRNV
jgi:hypothetical protein